MTIIVALDAAAHGIALGALGDAIKHLGMVEVPEYRVGNAETVEERCPEPRRRGQRLPLQLQQLDARLAALFLAAGGNPQFTHAGHGVLESRGSIHRILLCMKKTQSLETVFIPFIGITG